MYTNVSVLIMTEATSGLDWNCSVMVTPEELSQGLSNVASLAPGNGMLFDMGSEMLIHVQTYEMLFPISVVFINNELEVVGIIDTLNIGETATSLVPARYFLEVNVDEATDVDAGDSVQITGYIPATPPTEEVSVSSSIFEMMTVLFIVMMMMEIMEDMMTDNKPQSENILLLT